MASALTRRRVLTGSVAAAAAGVAACASSPLPNQPGGTPGGSTSGAPVAAGSAGTPVGAAADVPVGGALFVEELELVVTQPEAGRFTGLSAVCTHTGCIVNRAEGATLVCPCHGSRYGLDGAVQAGPAPRALDPRPVGVVDGQIVLQ
jgi:Rieske Fe-S protein